jgi:hypothetical protein
VSASVTCDYCGQPAELVNGTVIYPHRPDLRKRRFWRCAPCGAYVGTHENSEKATPFGRLANAELRGLKQRVHAAFDPIWQGREMGRTEAYKWLAKALGITQGECHIGMFDEDRCRAALAILAARGMAALDQQHQSLRRADSVTVR